MERRDSIKELEVKILNIDLDEMEEKILGLGGKLICHEYQENIIIDKENLEIQQANNYMRIRKTKSLLDGSEDQTLTFKKSISNDGIRINQEINTGVENYNSLIEIFSSLGYSIISRGYKTRKSYKLNKLRFDLDVWDKETYPNPYMEIEVEDEEDLKNIIRELEIDEANVSTKSIVELKKDLY